MNTLHGPLELPAFLPDATRAVVRAVDSTDLIACGMRGIVVNTFHLQSHPGFGAIESQGGVHEFMKWPGVVMSDSGGFQILSLADSTATKKGARFRLTKGGDARLLTPEKCIRLQFKAGADVLVCLDYCTHPDAPADEQRRSVDLTIQWAKSCREEFDRLVEQTERRPLLFAVVQGGSDATLRRECAERLLEIGFDGFGFGGWPIREGGRLQEMVQFVAELIPARFPKWGLGIGKPDVLAEAFRHGYTVFDCTIPTRDARHQRLYVRSDEEVCATLHIQNKRYARDQEPIDAGCDCLCCRQYSRAYVHHLFRIRDALALRLATIHNLRFYARLMERLRASGR